MTSATEGGAGAPPPAGHAETPAGTPGGANVPRYRPVGVPFQIPASPPASSSSAGSPRSVYRVGSPAPESVSQHSPAVRFVMPAVRLMLSLPLAYAAAVAAGAALWLWYLAGVGSPDEPPPGLLTAAGCGAALVAAATLLAVAVLLREQPRRRLWLWSAVVCGVGAAGAGAAALVGVSPLPTVAAATVLACAALVSLLCGGIGFWGLDTGLASDPRAVRPLGLLWRIPAALAASLAAAGSAFLTFSLAAASSLPAQREFTLGETLWGRATAAGGAGAVAHVLALLAVNAGAAALFGLFAHGAVRVLGWWRGRLHVWWCVLAAITVIVGLGAWLLDGSLPR